MIEEKKGPQEKLKTLFRLSDTDGDGYTTKKEIKDYNQNFQSGF